ncbi:MAG: hypothetical protein IPK07_18395 [Deltaproteobacteria bacterium]|nr:hypothetical protein [Deltaproteobacteria bacterium]
MRARWRIARGVLVCGLVAVVAAAGTARAELDDPAYHRAMMLLQGGDAAGAAEALAEPLARRAGELYVLEQSVGADPARLRALRGELAELERQAAIAEQQAGHAEQARQHLARLLALDGDAKLDPLETPRPLLLELEELRGARTAAPEVTRIELPDAPAQGIEHVPPLVVVRGGEITLYVRVADGRDARVTVDHCGAAQASAVCASPRRKTLARVRGDVFAGALPAAASDGAAHLRYRIGVVDGAGRSRSTPWYALTVVDDVVSHLDRAGASYGPRAQALLRAGSVEARLGSASSLPDGIREVDARASNLEVRRRAY